MSFDIERAIRESGLTSEAVARVLLNVAESFPESDPLYELKVIRALEAERAASMTPQAWLESVQQRAQELRSGTVTN